MKNKSCIKTFWHQKKRGRWYHLWFAVPFPVGAVEKFGPVLVEARVRLDAVRGTAFRAMRRIEAPRRLHYTDLLPQPVKPTQDTHASTSAFGFGELVQPDVRRQCHTDGLFVLA